MGVDCDSDCDSDCDIVVAADVGVFGIDGSVPVDDLEGELDGKVAGEVVGVEGGAGRDDEGVFLRSFRVVAVGGVDDDDEVNAETGEVDLREGR